MEVKLNYSLKEYNTFGIECRAKKFLEVMSTDHLAEVLLERDDKENLFILGGGSNILLKNDFNGLVLKYSSPDIKILEENNSFVLVEADAGAVWDDFVKYAVNRNLAGIENLSSIPGSVGAAPIQNIGAYGQELSQTFHLLNGLYIDRAERGVFKKEQCEFKYRESIFKKQLKNKFIITSVVLKLNKEFTPDYSYAPLVEEVKKLGLRNPEIADMRNLISQIRKRKLPDPKVIGNAGSFFKNPFVDFDKYQELQKKYPDIKGFPAGEKYKLYAGWLIEKCGWKGIKIGNVGSYSEQSLVIVNYGGATGEEILEFAGKIKRSVLAKFDIELEEEVNVI